MRTVLTRVTTGCVTVDGEVVANIEREGLLALVGVTHEDSQDSADLMARKIHELRILSDDRSADTAAAPILVVSQFTLYGQTAKGRRPTWSQAAPTHLAKPIIDRLVATLRERGAEVTVGSFGSEMMVTSTNWGPMTVLVET